MPRKATYQKKSPLRLDERGFRRDLPDLWSSESMVRQEYDPDKFISAGAWVMMIKTPPVTEHAAPRIYGIYWAVPFTRKGAVGVLNEKTGFYEDHTVTADIVGVDEYGRQCALIYTPYEVRVFPDEYTVITDEKLAEYRSMGWSLHETAPHINRAMNLELLERGRNLTEEEREIVYALQLDGLTEQQACEEYFLSRHTDDSNAGICYLPDPDVASVLTQTFGER